MLFSNASNMLRTTFVDTSWIRLSWISFRFEKASQFSKNADILMCYYTICDYGYKTSALPICCCVLIISTKPNAQRPFDAFATECYQTVLQLFGPHLLLFFVSWIADAYCYYILEWKRWQSDRNSFRSNGASCIYEVSKHKSNCLLTNEKDTNTPRLLRLILQVFLLSFCVSIIAVWAHGLVPTNSDAVPPVEDYDYDAYDYDGNPKNGNSTRYVSLSLSLSLSLFSLSHSNKYNNGTLLFSSFIPFFLFGYIFYFYNDALQLLEITYRFIWFPFKHK